MSPGAAHHVLGMGWHRGKERGAGAVPPDPVWPRGEVFGVDTPTGTSCSRWRSLLICSSACEAAKSAPGGVLQADSATDFWRNAQIPTTRWEMGNDGLLPGERDGERVGRGGRGGLLLLPSSLIHRLSASWRAQQGDRGCLLPRSPRSSCSDPRASPGVVSRCILEVRSVRDRPVTSGALMPKFQAVSWMASNTFPGTGRRG